MSTKIESSLSGNRVSCTIVGPGNKIKIVDIKHGHVRGNSHVLSDTELEGVCAVFMTVDTDNHRLRRLIREVRDELSRRHAAQLAREAVAQINLGKPSDISPAFAN